MAAYSWLHDGFNRTAVASPLGTCETGQTWAANYGALGINASGQCYCSAATGGGRSYIDPLVPDFTLNVTLAHRDGTSEAWVHFRTSSPGNALWRFGAGAGGNYVLQKYNNPTLTTVFTAGVPASGDQIQIVCSGTSIIVNVNGTTAGSTTDAFNDTATQIGLELYSSGAALGTFDNLDLPATMSAAADFGLYIPNNTELDAYYNGTLKDRFTVPDASASGSAFSIAAWHDTAKDGTEASPNPPRVLFGIDLVEVWDAPGGTLLFSDDFTSFSGWTVVTVPTSTTAQWSNWPASCLSVVCNSPATAMISRTLPTGGKYLRLRGVQFSDPGSGWVMGILHSSGAATDTPFHDSSNLPYYYRCLLEPPGSLDNTPRLSMATGTSAQPVVAPDALLAALLSVGVNIIRI